MKEEPAVDPELADLFAHVKDEDAEPEAPDDELEGPPSSSLSARATTIW